ncbi:RNA-binding domain-containing protein [Colletotrichum zoysiae]|uniref:RNA-binding domain-containing protein n=1 Tax=Colletotrichum zoysiae TaxID=1216348 RepID=A0AAD9H1M0_9PEZI|nr:RNA-binding domain-containing protein [Colletotrichum zoysiae]
MARLLAFRCRPRRRKFIPVTTDVPCQLLLFNLPLRKERERECVFCFVYYKDPQSVITAAENVDGTFWHGRRIVAKPQDSNAKFSGRRRDEGVREKPARVNQPYDGPPTSTLYIGNISFEASDADLNSLFASLDGIKDVRVAVDRATGWPRGFAHADFVTEEAATAAMEVIQGTQLHNRALRASYAPVSQKEVERKERMSRKSSQGGQNQSRNNSQEEVEQRVEAEHVQAEEAQKEQKPEAGKQDMNWNA